MFYCSLNEHKQEVSTVVNTEHRQEVSTVVKIEHK
jgi:hypothetical protein